ncbi:VOC family protein [Sphingobium phenoxybenzoativorans]|uniref:VOC family protein n=1 Tax=Sphingobium phenoxybenzoativorans TaxID=1592790 RepID=UPI0009F645C3|nr:VOC family protein [Sphingobium phenoxybenzoativorans]
MKQMLGMVMAGAKDIGALRRFYEDGLGWTPWTPADDNQVQYRLGGTVLVFLPLPYLEAERGVSATPRGNVSLAMFLSSKAEVDAAFQKALNAGATETSPVRERDFGVYSGYVADPEGNSWEICWSQFLHQDGDGSLQFRPG